MWAIAAKSEYPRTSIPETRHSREVIRPDHLTSQRLILLVGAHGQWDRPAGLATYVPSPGHGPVLRDRQQPAESGAHRSDGIRLRIIELDDLIEPAGLEYPAHRTGKRA